jgi:hypothetical protein
MSDQGSIIPVSDEQAKAIQDSTQRQAVPRLMNASSDKHATDLSERTEHDQN